MSYVGQKDFIILFVGRMEWRKGIATLIHALKLVKEKISNAKLVVVGGKIFGEQFNEADKKEYERLLEVADKLHNVKDDVKFVGAVNHGDLPKYYSSADVLVIPSYYEPFGLVAIEGLASKVPVVASRVGGLKVTILKMV
jgi:glycosyltransferase involved in cell wall biosynthesis